MKRRTFVHKSLSILGLTSVSAMLSSTALAAAADNYPTHAITIVVPHAPGGAVDGVARLFADKLKDELGQSVVVENRPGASGTIGAGHVARQAPDGYTLYINASIHNINPLFFAKDMNFDAVKDFTAVSMLAQGALIFGVNNKIAANNVKEFIAEIEANPKRYSFVTSGFGSAGHLSIAQFRHDIKQPEIPIALYKGAGPALQDLVGGQVSAMIDPMLSSLPHVKAGNLKALAVTGNKRSPLLPNVPTLKEQGVDFEMYSWYGLWAPANLPAPILKKLETTTKKVVELPEFRDRLTSLGFESAYKNSADFSKFIDVEVKRYAEIIESANIKVE